MLPMNGLKGSLSLELFILNDDRTVFHVGAIDPKLNDRGYIIPGYRFKL